MTSSRTHARQPREALTRVGRQKGCPPAPLGVPGAVGAGGGVPVAWVRALPPVKLSLLNSAQTVVLGRKKEFQLGV